MERGWRKKRNCNQRTSLYLFSLLTTTTIKYEKRNRKQKNCRNKISNSVVC